MAGRREEKRMEMALRERIRTGELEQTDVARRLAELAFGRCNDCVRLALENQASLDDLDLSLLAELKRSEKGAVEVKMVDRLQALEQLASLAGATGSGAEEFLNALRATPEATP